METIQLTLTLTEANLILDALGEKPFRDVFELIGKIQQQANEQLQSSEENSPLKGNTSNAPNQG